jgi:hypothetical protein
MSLSSKGRVEIQITNVQPEIKQQLKNIADYEGKTVSQFMRMKINEISRAYPDEVKQGRFSK